jgi:Na+/proline symporter
VHWIDFAIVGGYVAYSIASGLGSRKLASRGLEEYFLAGRSLKGWQAGVSMAATQFAADTPLVVTGMVATAGVFALWRFWVYAFAFLLMALVLGAAWRRSGVLTDAELSEFRYSGKSAAALRGAKAVYLGVIFNCTVLAMVLKATASVTEPFFLWNEWLPQGLYAALEGTVQVLGFPLTTSGAACADGACEAGSCIAGRCVGPADWVATTNNVLSIGAILAVTTLYSTTGGLRSVVRTDIAQFTLAMGGTFAFAFVVLQHVGGLSGLFEGLAAVYPADRSGPAGLVRSEALAFTPDRAHDVTLALLGVLAIQWICQINADGSGYLAQRTMACRSDRDARQAGVVFTVLQILVRSLVWLPIALGLTLIFPFQQGLEGSLLVASREATYVRGIAELMPPGVQGLLIAGMLGALASTLDTHLNWGSSYFTNDIYKRFVCPHLLRREPSPRSLVWVARLANLGILLLALALMPLMDSIQTAWKASLLLGAGLGVLLVLRWIHWRLNAVGELAALIASLFVAPLLLYLGNHDVLFFGDDASRLLTMAGTATAVGLLASLLSAPESHETLSAFYERVRPPGFWGPFSRRPGASVSRLERGLGATAASAFGIFCILVGVGTLMLRSPPPVFVPDRGVFVALSLLVGLALAALAYRLMRRTG